LPRGGADALLTDKRVALIGCGSVGGHVALELVRSGVLNLTLIDYDVLTTENIFRHVLGRAGVGRDKAIALRDEIRRLFPYTHVKTNTAPIEYALKSGEFQPKDFDLIMVAVGEPPLSLYLNGCFYDLPNAPPVIYTWVEAYGIGGHALLTLNGCRKGCYECLYAAA